MTIVSSLAERSWEVPERFSDRLGYRGAEQEITIREDAPEGLRFAVPLIGQDAGLSPTAMRRIVCASLLVRPDPGNWSDYPNIWDEVNALIENCPWFKVYDIIEKLHAAIAQYDSKRAIAFQNRLNQFLRENGIGWQMTDGQVVYRGSEAFTGMTREAAKVLTESGRSAAAREIHEALADISRRPSPDVTGAIQHSIAALECVARDVMGEPKLTLGRLASRLALTPPLDAAVEKLWGYASEQARHIREGQAVSSEEAELVVGVACSVCTFLTKRSQS